MEDILKKIEQASNGDWKKQMWMQNCVNWVIDNFDDIEPHIKRLWVEKETKKLGLKNKNFEVKGGQTLYIHLDKEK